jgi:rod shape-determining protein MreD
MIYFLILPFFSLILLVFQTTILNLFSIGKMSVELSLIAVIFAGFRCGAIKGAFFAFVTGFIFDCLTGAVSGLLTLYYVLVFTVARTLSFKVFSEGYLFIAVFSFICALFEAMLISLFYYMFYDVEIILQIYKGFIAQALVVGLLSPPLFKVAERLERIAHVGQTT